ncbi:hypothetical protein KIS4809_2255 [Bacillus sp. ZZV12-4809]|nr:hypothetical protein KIS4809_2255 [Bacillus sp. ZZV12-4809]
MAKYKNAENSSLKMFFQYIIKSFSPLMLHSIIYSNHFIEIVLNTRSFWNIKNSLTNKIS